MATAFQANSTLTIHDSQFNGHALTGTFEAGLRNARLSKINGTLALADASLALQGALGARDDKLTWQASLPHLNVLRPDLAGTLTLDGDLAGTWHRLALAFEIQGERLQWAKALNLATLNGRGHLALHDAGQLDIRLQAGNGRLGTLALDNAGLTIAGRRDAHDITLQAQGRHLALNARLSGGLIAEGGWQGRLVALDNRGRPALSLTAPTSLTLAPDKVAIGEMNLQIGDGRLMLHESEFSETRLITRGTARRISLKAFAPWLPSSVSPTSDLALDAEWSLAGHDMLDGTLRIARHSGDLVVLTQAPTPLGLNQLTLDLQIAQGLADLTVAFAGTAAGQATLQGSTRFSRTASGFGIAGSAPLQASAKARLASVAWLSALYLPLGASLDGALTADLTATGTMADPQLHGQLDGEQLDIVWPAHSLELRDGTLSATFAGRRLLLSHLGWDTAEGKLTATGWLDFGTLTPSMQLALSTESFPLLSRTDQWLVVSGEGQLKLADNQLDITGNFKADKGLIELPPLDRPALGEDVVVLHQPVSAKGETGPVLSRLELTLNLGDAFQLRGRGLDTTLAGSLLLRQTAGNPLQANGTINVTKGTYLAYGQTLTIERGTINFNGPLDNPGVNVRAVRLGPAVKSGVEIRGSAAHPRVQLVSDPEVPDSEKMSWLILGHGLDDAGKDQFALLSLAAGALLSGNESVPLQTRFAHAVGLDEFGVSGSGTESAVSFGKRLSSRVYLSYERGIATLLNAVRLTYQFTPAWSLRLQGGSDNAADVFYTFTFD